MAIDERRTRLLTWEGCRNARDLGGLPANDGRETRWGAIVRSDYPGHLSEAGRDAVIAHGIRTIVDLRLPDEIEAHSHPFASADAHGISYHKRPFISPDIPLPSNIDELSLVENYKAVLDRYRTSVGAVVKTIATAPEGGVLVHCSGGMGRTGMTSMLLLELASVQREAIAADYALSAECLQPETVEWLRSGPGDRQEREKTLPKNFPRAEVMIAVLEHLDSHYGGVQGYLSGAVKPQDVTRLRERLLSVDSDQEH